MRRRGITTPKKTLSRLQSLIGLAMAFNNDRNPNRFAQVTSALTEAHEICWRALSGEDLPEPKNHLDAA